MILYFPALVFSGYDAKIMRLISLVIVIFFIIEIIRHLKDKKELVLNTVFLLCNIFLPDLIFWLFFSF